ncbi:MAG: putative iron-regulated membrane protein [Candidatus Azotimanducaceae bacterium]|jgi:uncharacterized iron-regulated membrane protein
MRRLLINVHLYLAAFLAPMLLLVAVSGGLYLLNIKGEVTREAVVMPAGSNLDTEAPTLEADVRALLAEAGITHEFEYLRVSSNKVVTRPTSREHYQFNLAATGLTATRNTPDLQGRMMELHKGHGPGLFKDFQKVLSVGLMFIVLSGLWLGISARGLRNKTLLSTIAGLIVFLGVVFLA